MARTPSGLASLCVSRPYVEYRIPAGLTELPNVAIVAGRIAGGVTTSPDGETVTGVRTLAPALILELVAVAATAVAVLVVRRSCAAPFAFRGDFD